MRAGNAGDREAPEVLPKFRSRSVPVRGPIKRTEPRACRSRLSRKREPQVPMGELFPVLVETPEQWEVVKDLRRSIVKENPDEGSPELDLRHKEVAVAAGNR